MLQETLGEKWRTHIQAKRTESTHVFGYMGASMRVEDKRGKDTSTNLEISFIKGDQINNDKYEM